MSEWSVRVHSQSSFMHSVTNSHENQDTTCYSRVNKRRGGEGREGRGWCLIAWMDERTYSITSHHIQRPYQCQAPTHVGGSA